MSLIPHTGFYAMGTRCHILLPGTDAEQADLLFLNARQEIARIETILSRFIPNSELSRVNTGAAQAPVSIHQEVFDILKLCKTYHQKTNGAFDITVRGDIGMHHVHMNDADRSVRFDREGISLDLGGFGKGYALSKIQQMLVGAGIRNAFVSFGESSILTMGSHPAGDHWKIGVRDSHEFALNDGSVSTSSNVFVDDVGQMQNHRHVINPKTGRPVEEKIAVSVKSDSAVEAEIVSTAGLVCSDEDLSELRSRFPNCEIIKINYEHQSKAVS